MTVTVVVMSVRRCCNHSRTLLVHACAALPFSFPSPSEVSSLEPPYRPSAVQQNRRHAEMSEINLPV